MSKTISNAALGLYAGLVGIFVPIPDRRGLIRDLKSDPFLGSALQGAASELYHRYGTWLAPLTATLITLKHARFAAPSIQHRMIAETQENTMIAGTQEKDRVDPTPAPDVVTQQAPP